MASNPHSNSLNLQSASSVEKQQEALLKLTNEVKQPIKSIIPTNNQPNNPQFTVSSGISNEIFPSTLVGSSLSVGGNSKLPSGSAGFGSVEAVDLGSVNIQAFSPVQQNQNLQTFQQNQNLDTLPNYGQPTSSQNSFGPTFAPNNNVATYGSQGPSQGTVDSLPTYNNRPESVQTNNFQQNIDNLPSYNSRPEPNQNPNYFQNNQDSLPSYGQQAQNTLLANQFKANNFEASRPLNAQPNVAQINVYDDNQASWKGANNFQNFYQNGQNNPYQSLNSPSQLTPLSLGNTNERPVRFPGDASNRYDILYEDTQYSPYENSQQAYYDLPYEHYSGQNSAAEASYYSNNNQYYSTPTPNILAELARYSKKTNLFQKPRENTYIQYPTSHEMEEPDKELILYPSGQLISQPDIRYPNSYGPTLRSYLATQSSFQHDQTPHYVVARKKPSYERKTELFDPLLEGDEIIERGDFEDKHESDLKTTSSNNKEGFLPVLIRTATDDLRFVGDVLKMAFSKK